jgi:hypothetical protein
MIKYSYQWVKEWCDENGWTDLFIERYHYWAFPPGAVMPVPVPTPVLEAIRSQRGWTLGERIWISAAIGFTIAGASLGYLTSSPMPFIGAFAFCAVVVGLLED